MHVIKIYSNNIRQKTSFGNDFNYPKEKRTEDLIKLQNRVALLPEHDEELGEVIKKSPSFNHLYKRIKEKPQNVRNFYIEQTKKLANEAGELSSKQFLGKIGPLVNSVLNTECGISVRARGKALSKYI